MKSAYRSPAIKRATDKARAIGYRVAFVDYITGIPAVMPPAGACRRDLRLIQVSTAFVDQQPEHLRRETVAAIIEHELEHALGADRGTDFPHLGLRCGGLH